MFSIIFDIRQQLFYWCSYSASDTTTTPGSHIRTVDPSHALFRSPLRVVTYIRGLLYCRFSVMTLMTRQFGAETIYLTTIRIIRDLRLYVYVWGVMTNKRVGYHRKEKQIWSTKYIISRTHWWIVPPAWIRWGVAVRALLTATRLGQTPCRGGTA